MSDTEIERLREDAIASRRAWVEERAEVVRLREALSIERQARLVAEIELDRLRPADLDPADCERIPEADEGAPCSHGSLAWCSECAAINAGSEA